MSTKSLAKAASIIVAATVISRVLGFLRESLLSYYFGKGYVIDAYNTAFVLPDLFYALLVAGALSSAFIPVVTGYLASGKEEDAWEVASSIINLVLVLLCLLVVGALFFAPRVIEFYIPGFPAETKQLAVTLVRIILIQPVFLSLSGFAMGILNSRKIFGPPAVGAAVYSTAVILFGVVLQPFFPPGQGIKAFALGVVLGALGNFLVQVPALKRVGFRYRLNFNLKHPGVRRIALLAFPIVLSFSLNQIMVVVYQNLISSLMPGSLAAFGYAYKLQQLPIGIFAGSIGVAVFPTLTELIAKNDWQQFRHSFSAAFRSILFVTVPITVGMIVLAKPLIEVVYQHGHFGSNDTLEVAAPLIYFSLGIVPQSALVFLPRAFYAMQDTWTPVILGFVSLVINVVLMNLLVGPMGVGGLALAMSVSNTVNMLWLIYLLRRRIGTMDGRRILNSFLKICFASAAMGTVVLLALNGINALLPQTKTAGLVKLTAGSGLGAAVFLLGAFLLKMPELSFVLRLLQRKRG